MIRAKSRASRWRYERYSVLSTRRVHPVTEATVWVNVLFNHYPLVLAALSQYQHPRVVRYVFTFTDPLWSGDCYPVFFFYAPAIGRLVRREFIPDQLPSLIEAIFTCEDIDNTIRRLPRDDAQIFVDIMDEVCCALVHCAYIWDEINIKICHPTRCWINPIFRHPSERNASNHYIERVAATRFFRMR